MIFDHRLANHLRFFKFSLGFIPILRLSKLTYISLEVPRRHISAHMRIYSLARIRRHILIQVAKLHR